MNDESNNLDDSEEELALVFLDGAIKSLQTWINFFEQQEADGFKSDDGRVFRKNLKTVHKLKLQTLKQAQITNFLVKN